MKKLIIIISDLTIALSFFLLVPLSSTYAFGFGGIGYDNMPLCDPNNLPWTRFSKYGTRSDDAFKLKSDNCGNIYIAGTSDYTGNLIDIFVIKYNSAGDTVWTQFYNGRDSGSISQDKIGDLAIDTSGNVYVSSAAPGSESGSYDWVTMKFNSDGVLQWRKKLDFRFEDIPLAMCADNSGNVAVTGYSRSSGSSAVYLTIKYNSSGDTLWTRTYSGDNNEGGSGRGICSDNSGNIYITGNSPKFAQGNDYVTIKYNSGGTVLWNRRYNSPLGNSQDIPTAMAIDASSNIYITGYSDSVAVSMTDYLTVKYNSNGDLQWTSRYNGTGFQEDYPLALAVDANGNVAVTGYSKNASANYDMVTLLYNSAGARLWEQRHNGTGNYNDVGRAISFDTSGNVYAAGNIYNANSDAVVYKYSSAGLVKGFRSFNGSYNKDDFFRAVAIDPLGNVHAAGRMNYDNFNSFSLTKKFPQSEFGFTLKMSAIIQGFHYSSSTPFMRQDTVRVFLRNSTSPYGIVDSSKQVFNNVGYGEFFFTTAQTGVNYYVSVKHRNSIETWSASGSWINFSADTTSYNFTNAVNKAFGSNMKQVNASPLRFGFYGGDVNQDGTVDATDISLVDNDATFFISGYVLTDLTGDNFVDGTDFAIADNNATGFVSVSRP